MADGSVGAAQCCAVLGTVVVGAAARMDEWARG
jgi:hypothetical protein